MGALEEARTHFGAGAFEEARAAALAGLASSPDDVELLRLAGRAGVETGAPDAVGQLQRLTQLAPEDAAGWRDLGDALATEGRTEEAGDAFRKAVELDPSDEVSLTALGHTSFAAGQGEEAVGYLERAASHAGGASSAAISLVEMYRSFGELDQALAAAVNVAEGAPGDTLAALDVAELSLETGKLDDALGAFDRVRSIDELPDHEVYALHGMVRAEMARENWERALELAREASAVDRYGRTTAVLAFLDAQVSGAGDEPPPSREEVEASLDASLAEHRRAHAEDRGSFGEDELLG